MHVFPRHCIELFSFAPLRVTAAYNTRTFFLDLEPFFYMRRIYTTSHSAFPLIFTHLQNAQHRHDIFVKRAHVLVGEDDHGDQPTGHAGPRPPQTGKTGQED